jgi:hypothetical protein
MRVQKLGFALAIFLMVSLVGSVSAQVVSPELDACRSTGLIALKEHKTTAQASVGSQPFSLGQVGQAQ